MSDVLNQVGVQNGLTVGVAAVSLTLPAGLRPTRMLVHVKTSPIRWRAGGTAPTSTTGMPVAAGSYIDLMAFDARGVISTIQLIRDADAGADATVNVAFFG